MSRFFQNRAAGGFRLDSPVKVPAASEMPRCAPPHTKGPGRNHGRGGERRVRPKAAVQPSHGSVLQLSASCRPGRPRELLRSSVSLQEENSRQSVRRMNVRLRTSFGVSYTACVFFARFRQNGASRRHWLARRPSRSVSKTAHKITAAACLRRRISLRARPKRSASLAATNGRCHVVGCGPNPRPDRFRITERQTKGRTGD